MGGDYTRWTFDPAKDYAELFKQQGRVDLDADWNEFVEIVNRRWRTETIDIIGRAIVPKSTPNAFQITSTGPGQFAIGIGRIYADGLLVECHGIRNPASDAYDASLGEVNGTVPIPFDKQPYYPFPIPPPSGSGSTDLIYLDVWQREVTAIQDPSIREKALGGPDTATRVQTVWQVKILPKVGSHACGDDIPEWNALVGPSAGRITTSTVVPPPSPDPCILSPTGGYRGLENRLYRVEIYKEGTVGGANPAKFMWSRDNGSVISAVDSISAPGGPESVLTLKSFGRDRVLRFKKGDWVEILDNDTEFASQAGYLTQISEPPDEANRTITVEPPVPAGLFDPTDDSRHTRVRRWDQQYTGPGSDVDPTTGLIDVTTGPLDIEQGIQVSFSADPAGSQLKVGDYWIFAARTADGSVESLLNAPPKGILHHYARLGFMTWVTGKQGSFTDCRQFWPPDFVDGGCDCSVCVTVESHNSGALTIQHAIDQVKAIGGTVCLGVGTYNLGETVRIEAAQSVRVRGHGEKTNLLYTGRGSALVIDGSTDVTVEELMIATRNTDVPGPAVAVSNSVNVTLRRNVLLRLVSEKLGGPAIGLGGVLIGIIIRENVVWAPTGIGNMPAAMPSTGIMRSTATAATAVSVGEPAPLLTASLRVEDNMLICAMSGIRLTGVSVHTLDTRLAGNVIQICPQGGIVMLGFVAPGSGVDVHANEIQASGPGIVIGTDGTRITDNNISPIKEGSGGAGIVLAVGLDSRGLDQCQVLGNRIVDVAGDGISILAVVNSAMIKNNVIEAVGGGGIVMDDASRGGLLTIENNQLINIAPLANDPKTPVTGIRVIKTDRAEIVGNAIQGVGVAAAQSPTRAGIQVINTGSARIDGNEVLNIGPQTDFLQDTAAIDCLGTFERVDVTNNTVRRWLAPPKNTGTSRWYAVRIGTQPSPGLIVIKPNLSLMASRDMIYVIGNKLTALPRGREIVGVQGNLLEAYGVAPVISVVTGGVLTLSTNRCLLSTAGDQSVPVAHAQVGAVMVSANYLEGPTKKPALTLQLPNTGPFTVLGNVVSGVIMINGLTLGDPWAPLNVLAF